MSVVRDRQRRLVGKSFSGAASLQARLLNMSLGTGLTQLYEDVVALLELDISPVDCHRLSGLSLGVIRTIARELGQGAQRPGRRPKTVSIAFTQPGYHLWLSIFLDHLIRLARHEDQEKEFYSTETFLHALYATRQICGNSGFELGGRYLIVGATQILSGELYMTTCRRCATRYVKSTVDLMVGGSIRVGYGVCPFCTSMGELISQRSTEDGAPVDEDEMQLGRSTESARANFELLISTSSTDSTSD